MLSKAWYKIRWFLLLYLLFFCNASLIYEIKFLQKQCVTSFDQCKYPDYEYSSSLQHLKAPDQQVKSKIMKLALSTHIFFHHYNQPKSTGKNIHIAKY